MELYNTCSNHRWQRFVTAWILVWDYSEAYWLCC